MLSPSPTWNNERLSDIFPQRYSKRLTEYHPFILRTDYSGNSDAVDEDAENLPVWVYVLVGILVGVGIVSVIGATWLFYWVRQRRQQQSCEDPLTTSPLHGQKRRSFSPTCVAAPTKLGDSDGSTCCGSGCPEGGRQHARFSIISDMSPTTIETSTTAVSMGARNSSATDGDVSPISGSILPPPPSFHFPSIATMAVKTGGANQAESPFIFEITCRVTYLTSEDSGE